VRAVEGFKVLPGHERESKRGMPWHVKMGQVWAAEEKIETSPKTSTRNKK